MSNKNTKKKQNSGKEKFQLIIRSVFGLVLVAAVCVLVVRCAAGRKDYADFLNDLGRRESSDRYDAKNQYGYLGRYQMGELALMEAGFLDGDGRWTELANSYGIFSEADFLNSPEGQDAAIKACHRRLWEYIRIYELDSYAETVYCGVRVTPSGLLAACHLVGAKRMQEALATGEKVCDGNGVSAAEYMKRFAGYDISDVWEP